MFNRVMLSLAEISDRFEIQQLLIDYSTAIDQRRFDDLDRVFTPDAYIDYRAAGGIDGGFPDVKAWLAEVLPNFPAYSHMLGNFDVRIDGDTASSRTICFNPMVLNAEAKQVLFIGIWYDDEFVRTPDGWRMSRRVETKCFDKLSETTGRLAGRISTDSGCSGTMGGCLPRDYVLLGGHTREAKPDRASPPVSLNCSVATTGEFA